MDFDTVQVLPQKPSKEERKWIKKDYSKAGWILLMHLGLTLLLAVIITLVYKMLGVLYPDTLAWIYQDMISSPNKMTFGIVLENIIIAVVAYPIVYFVGCAMLKVRPGAFFQRGDWNGKFLLSMLVVSLALQVAGGTFGSLIVELGKQAGVNFTTIDISAKPDPATNFMMYILACVSAPIFEEMIFRGLMLRALSKVSPKFGIIASAALFGIFHQNIPQAVNAFLIGIALGYAAYKSGSIIPGIIIHFVLNANGIIQEGIASKSETAAGIVFILLALVFVACAIAIIIANRKKISLPVVAEQTKGRTFPVFITSVPVIIALIGEIALTLTSIQKM
jgi:hypothetical protein